jgi:hypothetical protein
MKLGWRFNSGRRMDRSQITEKKCLRISISTTLRFGVEVKVWPIRKWHQSGSIRVIPALNTVVVTTGGRFDIPEIEDLLIPILLQSSRPRPANPEGEAVLQATLASIQQNDTIHSGLSTPEIAKVVSGRMYICESNPAGLESAQFDFTDPKVTVLSQESFGQDLGDWH